MTELKTQNELFEECINNESHMTIFEFKEKERQEAIKWIKTLRTDESYTNELLCGVDKSEWVFCLKTFFNISEGDL